MGSPELGDEWLRREAEMGKGGDREKRKEGFSDRKGEKMKLGRRRQEENVGLRALKKWEISSVCLSREQKRGIKRYTERVKD